MNERIKELKKQAWDYAMAVHDGHVVPPADKAVWPMDEVFDEKFAELIVKDCMEQVWYTREDSINGNVSEVIKQRIEQHFGVEE